MAQKALSSLPTPPTTAQGESHRLPDRPSRPSRLLSWDDENVGSQDCSSINDIPIVDKDVQSIIDASTASPNIESSQATSKGILNNRYQDEQRNNQLTSNAAPLLANNDLASNATFRDNETPRPRQTTDNSPNLPESRPSTFPGGAHSSQDASFTPNHSQSIPKSDTALSGPTLTPPQRPDQQALGSYKPPPVRFSLGTRADSDLSPTDFDACMEYSPRTLESFDQTQSL